MKKYVSSQAGKRAGTQGLARAWNYAQTSLGVARRNPLALNRVMSDSLGRRAANRFGGMLGSRLMTYNIAATATRMPLRAIGTYYAWTAGASAVGSAVSARIQPMVTEAINEHIHETFSGNEAEKLERRLRDGKWQQG